MDDKTLKRNVFRARVTNWLQKNLVNPLKEAVQVVKGVVVAISEFEELKFEVLKEVFQGLKEKYFK